MKKSFYISHGLKWPSIIGFTALLLWLSILPSHASNPSISNPTNSLIGKIPVSQINNAKDGVKLCEEAIAFAEQRMGIPSKLLHAIALGESGRGLPKDLEQSAKSINGLTLWPWTVMAEGRGRYFNSKYEAIKEVTKLRHKKVTNIDVGCMQVNLKYHGKAFSDIKQAFDPIHNVAYAASFLKQLRTRHRSWTKAVKYYHSGTVSKHTPYAIKIISLWQKLQHHTAANKVASSN